MYMSAIFEIFCSKIFPCLEFERSPNRNHVKIHTMFSNYKVSVSVPICLLCSDILLESFLFVQHKMHRNFYNKSYRPHFYYQILGECPFVLGVQLCFRRFLIDGFSGKWWSK